MSAQASDLKIQMWPVEKVTPYERNVKIHDEKQVSKIAESIRRFGWDQPIVVDKNGVIIKGHGRTLAAKKLGLSEVPVLVRDDLSEDEVNAARVADNRVAMGDIDTEMLQQELASIELDLDGIFDSKELSFLASDLAEINDESVVPDIVQAMDDQSDEMNEHIKQTDERDVRIADALGFRSVSGSSQRVIARFMARIEAETGEFGSDAFVSFCTNYIEN